MASRHASPKELFADSPPLSEASHLGGRAPRVMIEYAAIY